MKKLLSIILAISIALAAPVKAEVPDMKTIAGYTLLTVGLASAFCAAKLWDDYKSEKETLARELTNFAGLVYDRNSAWERHKKNFLRMSGSYAASLASFSTISTGLVLLAYKLYNK